MSRNRSPRRPFDPASRSAKCNARIEPLETRSMMSATPLAPPVPAPSPAQVAAEIRTYDGTGNNIAQTEWGSTGEQLLRRSPVAYADGISSPSGADRPSARLVSNLLSQSPAEGILNDRDWSAFVYAWGQFLDHDIGLTDAASPRERFAVAVPAGDSWFDPAGTGTATISMSRSAYDPATGVGPANPRQQTNSITAFIDGSQVYGSDATRAAALREFVGGLLKTTAGNLLPFNAAGLANANDAHRVADDRLFLAGDVRANENPELLALQTLFVREHNRIAADAARSNPGLTDEQLYQHARRIVIAELQKITYEEFLPALLGGPKPGVDGIQPYRGYRADVNPGITTEFSTVAFRVGHSMLGSDIDFLAADGTPVREPLSLRDAFFNPAPLSEVGIEPILKYLASTRGQEIDTKVVDDVRNFLFGAPGQGGFDLAALNIQRGRDHGIADYNTVRAAYGLPRVTSFAEITPDATVRQALEQAYGSVDRVDPWIGGLAEKHLAGSSLGATFTRIIVDQFTRLRDGDRFWYQNRGTLSADAVRVVQAATLADVIRRNSGLVNVQPEVFAFRTAITGTVFADASRDGRRQPLGGPATPGRTVSITRGGEVRGIDVGLPPLAKPQPPARPQPPVRSQGFGIGPSLTAMAFASLAAGIDGGLRARKS